MKTTLIVILAVVALANCQGGPSNSNPEKVHVVDYNPIGDQVYNSNGNRFVPDSFFNQHGNNAPVENETPQIRPYPYKQYANPNARGGK